MSRRSANSSLSHFYFSFGIICGQLWGSLAVGDHSRYCTVHLLHSWAVDMDVLKIWDKSSASLKCQGRFLSWQRQNMLKKIRLTSGWRASLKKPSLKLPDRVCPHVNDRKWIFLYSVNSRICGQFEPFRDFFLEPCSSHRPNVSFWNWNSVTQGIYGLVRSRYSAPGLVHPYQILISRNLP